METAPVLSEYRQDMSEKKSQRGTAVGQKTHQRTARSDRAASPVINHPQTHDELTRRTADEAPSQDKIGPPHGDPQAEKPGGMAKPPGVRRRLAEQIEQGAAGGEITQQG